MTDAIILLVIVAYLFLAWLVVKWIYHSVKSLHWLLRFVIFSFFCALFFGLDLIGGGGPHGYAMPVPLIVSTLFAGSVNSVTIVFLFWWVFILVITSSVFFFRKFWAGAKEETTQ